MESRTNVKRSRPSRSTRPVRYFDRLFGFLCFALWLVPTAVAQIAPPPVASDPGEPKMFGTIREFLDVAGSLSETTRVRVLGTVTYVNPEGSFFIEDQTAGVFVFRWTNVPPRVSDLVEVSGLRSLDSFSPVLKYGLVERLGSGVLPKPARATTAGILGGKFDMQLVRMVGRLSPDRLRRAHALVLILEDHGDTFTAEINPLGNEGRLAALRPGSLLAVTGICSVRADAAKRPASFHLFVRSMDDLVVLKPPPWWTPTRTLLGLGFVAFGLVLALGWAGVLRRQVRKQTGLIRERLQKEAAIESQFRELVENAADVIYTHDLEGRITSWNRAGETILGYPRAELIGQPFSQLVVPEQMAVARRMTARQHGDQAPMVQKLTLRARDGRRLIFEISSWRVLRDDRSFAVQGIGRDITERERAEEIRETLRDFAQQLTAPMSLHVLGQIVASECRRLFAYDAFLFYVVHPHTGERRAVRAEDTALGASEPVEVTMEFEAGKSKLVQSVFEGRQKRIDRLDAPTESTATPWGFAERRSESLLFNPVRWEGRCVGVLSVQSYTPSRYTQRDLELLQVIADQCGAASTRVQDELALRASEEKLRLALDAARMGTWDWNIATNAVRWSERVDRIFGLNPGQFAGTHDAYLALLHPEDRPSIATGLDEGLKGNREDYACEHRVRWPDDSIHWVEVNGRIYRDDTGHAIRMAGTMVDITERKRSEHALQESERNLFEFLEASPIGVFVIDRHGQTYFANQNAKEILGQGIAPHAAPSELARIYQAYLAGTDQLYPAERLPLVRALAGERVTIEDMEIRRDGRVTPIQVWAAPIYDAAGQVAFAIAAFADISERRRVQEELRASEEKFSRAFRRSPDSIVISRLADGHLIEVNEGFEELFGYTAREALGRSTLELNIWADAAHRTASIQAVRDHGFVRNLEVQLRTKAGALLTCLASAEQIEIGGQPCMVSITRDISDRKRAEQALRESEERYRLFSELASDFVYSVDLIRNPLVPDWATDSFHRITGYTLPELEAKGGWLKIIHRDDLAALQPTIEDMLHGQPVVSEYRIFDKSGEIHWLRDYVRPVLAPAGQQVIRITGGVQDITERKRAEQQIEILHQDLERRVEQRTAELRAVNKELEAFSYSISHDLRAPLRHITGFANLLLEHPGLPQAPDIRRQLNIIAEAAKRLGHLVDDLLQFSRMGRVEMHTTLNHTDQLVAAVRHELKAELADRAIEWQVESLPDVHADPVMLRLVWQNLLSNAIKYSRDRQPARIEIGSRETEAETVFQIRDNGAGFEMKYADKLFGVFQRLHREDEFEGTGIGLANVRRIIHRHGGRTWAEGEIDQGATFYFSLPRRGAPPSAAPDPKREA